MEQNSDRNRKSRFFFHESGQPPRLESEGQTGKEESETLHLYSAEAIESDFKRKLDGVRLQFFCSTREKPPVPYEKAIKDYSHLPRDQKRKAEDRIDELFTEEEVSELRQYLNDYGDQPYIEVFEVPLPLEVTSTLRPLKEMGGLERRGIFPLEIKEECSLSVDVCVFYDLKEALPSMRKLNLRQKQLAIFFANCLLQELNYPLPPNYGEIFEDLYGEGMVVVENLGSKFLKR